MLVWLQYSLKNIFGKLLLKEFYRKPPEPSGAPAERIKRPRVIRKRTVRVLLLWALRATKRLISRVIFFMVASPYYLNNFLFFGPAQAVLLLFSWSRLVWWRLLELSTTLCPPDNNIIAGGRLQSRLQ